LPESFSLIICYQIADQQRAHEEELARYQQLNTRASQEILNQEALLQGNLAQLQAQLLEAQALARNQCETPALNNQHALLKHLFRRIASSHAAALEIAAKDSQISALEAKIHDLTSAHQAATARVARVSRSCFMRAFPRACYDSGVVSATRHALASGQSRSAAQQRRSRLARAGGGGDEARVNSRFCGVNGALGDAGGGDCLLCWRF
jgi:hypothetical protein